MKFRHVLFYPLISFLLMALFSHFSFAMNCSYDSTAYITLGEDVKWSCWNLGFQYGKCYSIVLYGEDVLTVFPEPQDVQGIGMVDYFYSSSGLLNVYFKTIDLYEGYNYTFKVLCGEEGGSRTASFSATVIPVFHDLHEVGYRAIWFKDNIPYLLGFGGIILVVVGLYFAVRRL